MEGGPFFRLLGQRRSVRSFTSGVVSDKQVGMMMEACDMAPSSGGLQTYEVYGVRKSESRRRLSDAAHDQESVAQAPLVLVFCANPSRSEHKYGERSQLFSVQDATIAAAYCQLAITALGLATVWIGAFDEKKVSQALGLAPGLRPVAMLPVGHGSRKPDEKTTRGAADLLHMME